MIQYRKDLPDLMRKLGLPMVAAELGCAEMFFTNDLLEGGIEKLYCVDAWRTLNVYGDGANSQEWHDKNFNDGMKRIAKHGEKAIILRGLTVEMAELVPDGSLGLLYLDAGHDYASVYNDLVAWTRKVVKGGIVAGHDYLNPAYGVAEAVKAFTGNQIYVIEENKPEDAGFLFIN